MRGFASVVAGLVIFALLVVAVAAVMYAGVDAQRVLSEAVAYRQGLQTKEQRTSCSILNVVFSAGRVTVSAVNNGQEAVPLSDVGLILDGVYVGRCGTLTCVDATRNNVVSPGEEFNVTTPASSPPTRVTLVFGLSTCVR